MSALPQKSFIFVRHGQTDWNAKGLFQGHTDVPLNATGEEQAKAAARILAGQQFDRVVSSPLQRASATARAIAEASGKPLVIDEGLIECDFGSLEGESYASVAARCDSPRDLIDHLAPDGEPWAEVLERAETVVGRWLAAHGTETVVFVAHDALLQALSERLVGEWFASGHAVPYRFAPSPSGWTRLVVS